MFNDEYLVVELLLAEIIVDVAEELLQLTCSVSIRDDNCCRETWITIFRPEFASQFYLRFIDYVFSRELLVEIMILFQKLGVILEDLS